MIRRNHIVSAGALLFYSIAAHAVDTTYTFDSISKLQHSFSTSTVILTGVLAGDTAPGSIALPAESGSDRRCEQLYHAMLKNQGIYTLIVTTGSRFSDVPGGPPQTIIYLVNCSLELKP